VLLYDLTSTYIEGEGVRIPTKAVTDYDLIPVTDSEAKPVTLGAQRRWRR
jgi:hypothetical protein